MAEPDGNGGSPFWRILRIIALILAIIFFGGIAAGFLGAHLDHGDEIDATFVLVLGVVASVVLGCAWLLWREFRTHIRQEPLNRQERLYRKVMIGSCVAGLVIAMVMIFANPRSLGEGGGVFSNAPLPTGIAIVLVLVIGLLGPALSLYSHRIIDEQEENAARAGALIALYVYMIGAPVWWLSWRGGFAPAPDGFVIYAITLFTFIGIWLWRKYR